MHILLHALSLFHVIAQIEQFTLQNEAALMSHRIRAVEHRRCAAGLASAHPGLQDRILLNKTQELRMRI